MADSPRLSTVDTILKGLKKSKRELCQLAKDLPDEDAYAMPYCILSDAVRRIDECIEGLKLSIKEANAERKLNPDQSINRARKWCAINDSRRKSSAGSKDAVGTNEEAG